MLHNAFAIGGIFGNAQAPLARAPAFNSDRDSAPGSRDQRGFFVPELTAEQVRAAFRYDADTGILYWNARRPGVTVGSEAGCVNSRGYLTVGIDYKIYYTHRIIWLHAHGVWPDDEIDHLNGIKTDNRICNLRNVSVNENRHNQRMAHKNSSHGFLGVSKYRDKWRASCAAYGRRVQKSGFATPELAYAAYLEMKRSMQPGNLL